MSTTCTATTLVARDYIQSDAVNLSNFMCIFILTKGNGTLFNASSMQEEDVIQICIQLWHTHPDGVLWYSAIESVMLFHTVDELQGTGCGVMNTPSS